MSIRHLEPDTVAVIWLVFTAVAAFNIWALLYRRRERRKARTVELCGNCDGPLPSDPWRIGGETDWRGNKATPYCSERCALAALAKSEWNGADE